MAEDKGDFDLSMFFREYLEDAKEGFRKGNASLLEFEKDHSQRTRLDELLRVFHTLKSSSAMLHYKDVSDLAHAAENIAARIKRDELPVSGENLDFLFELIDLLEQMVSGKEKGREVERSGLDKRITEIWDRIRKSEQESSISFHPSPASEGGGRALAIPVIEKIDKVKVDVKLLDELFNLVGEIIINKNRISNLLVTNASKELKGVFADQERKLGLLREYVSSARLVTVGEVLQKFPRMVRDLSRAQNKDIELVLEGREIEIDKSVLDSVTEPLLHLLRNSVDHGIESREEREKTQKRPRGTIKLVVRRTENHIVIDVEDDGRGIDIKQIKDIALARDFVTQEEIETMEDKDIINILFSPGFSTANEVTGLSGRGVGLNVVKTVAGELGGIVEVATEKGAGTRFSLTIPVTTTIVRTLIIGVAGHVYAIPSSIVLETLKLDSGNIQQIGDRSVFMRGEEVLPFVWLGKIFGLAERKEKDLTVVLIQRGESFVGLGVDIVLDQMDSIVKPLDRVAREFRGFSGGIVMGDGSVVLLLDIPTLLNFKTVQKERVMV